MVFEYELSLEEIMLYLNYFLCESLYGFMKVCS